MKSILKFFCLCVLFTIASSVSIQAAELTVKAGRKVTLNYVLSVDGKIINSSVKKQPLQYIHGTQSILPALAKQLEGLHVGDEKSITLEPKDAFGIVDPSAYQEIPKSSLPKNLLPKMGMVLEMKGSDGRAYPAIIAQVRKDTIILDFNHPLAGKRLNYLVKILAIE